MASLEIRERCENFNTMLLGLLDMNKRFFTAGIALVAALLVAGIWLRNNASSQETANSTAAPAPEVRPALSVSTITPLPVTWPIRLSANGNIAAWQEASVGSEVNGLRVTEVRSGVGDVVKKGQVLAIFSDSIVKAEVAQAVASVAEAEAMLASAKMNADRTRQMKAPGAMSAQQVNEYLTAEQTAIARVQAAKAQLLTQRTRLEQTQLLAPDDGIISARTATVGEVVGADRKSVV
jgi:RND family efflux transporter MFP subunit